jgi:hypothetical protein
MKRLLAAAVLTLFGAALGPACSSQGGGAPQAPCDDTTLSHAPFCGSACVAKCGCKSCDNGDLLQDNAVKYICQAGCFQPLAIADAGEAGASDAAPDVDCTGVSCAPASICNQCTAACGCCACKNGEFKTIDEQLYVCLVNCYTPFALDGGGGV